MGDPPARLCLGRLQVDAVDQESALRRIEDLVEAGRGGLVFTPNVHHVVLAEKDPEFRAAYAEADLCLADGMPIVWASRLLGPSIPERVAGSDLVLPLARRAAALGWKLYLLGGAQGVAEAAAERLQAATGASVAGTDSPEISLKGPDDSRAALDRLKEARPEIVIVALGAPKQEVWMHRHRAAIAPAVALGLGASLDFASGRIRRAPTVMVNSGLEWLWRLGREPRRLWRRYLVEDLAFASIFLRTLNDQRRQSSGSRRKSS